jgi:magnesium chelatase subunit I
VDEGIAITTQEAWTARNGNKLSVPKFVREVIERVAFAAREDKKSTSGLG